MDGLMDAVLMRGPEVIAETPALDLGAEDPADAPAETTRTIHIQPDGTTNERPATPDRSEPRSGSCMNADEGSEAR